MQAWRKDWLTKPISRRRLACLRAAIIEQEVARAILEKIVTAKDKDVMSSGKASLIHSDALGALGPQAANSRTVDSLGNSTWALTIRAGSRATNFAF